MISMRDSENKAQPNPNMLSYYVQHTFKRVSKYFDVHHTLL
jgi:hypothetical protein